MIDPRLWLAALTALPLLVIGSSFVRIGVERLRQFAVASAAAMLVATLAIRASESTGALITFARRLLLRLGIPISLAGELICRSRAF